MPISVLLIESDHPHAQAVAGALADPWSGWSVDVVESITEAREYLLRHRPDAAVPLGCAGAGELRPGIGPDAGANVQPVTARNPAGRVDDDVLAHFGAFGVQVLLHP